MARTTAIGSALIQIGRELRVQGERLEMAHHRFRYGCGALTNRGPDQARETRLELFRRQMQREGIKGEDWISGAVGQVLHASVSVMGPRGPNGLEQIRLAVDLDVGAGWRTALFFENDSQLG